MRTNTRKILAILLAAALLFSNLPVTAIAEATDSSADTGYSITSFAVLQSDVSVQSVAIGTFISELTLPDTLDATGCAVSVETSEEMEITIPSVTWQSTPEYDPNMPDTYTFTAILPDGYVLADGVELPVITVEVAEIQSEVIPVAITAFTQLDEMLATQYWNLGTTIDKLNLPDSLTATIQVVSDGQEREEVIPVSEWVSVPAYEPNTLGTYVFSPMLDLQPGYSVVSTATIPAVTVTIKELMGISQTSAASQLATTINNFNPGNGEADKGQLTAVIDQSDASGNTVTVSGDVTGATNPLNLNIDADVTVKWQATYSGAIAYSNTLMNLTGFGTFEVISGGSIVNSGNGYAIFSSNAAAASDTLKIAVSGGTVSSAGTAIILYGNNSAVIVSGGTVSCTGGQPGIAISSQGNLGYNGSIPTVTVSGGNVTSNGRQAIVANGNVNISGTAMITSPYNYAISVGGNITVSGGTVKSTGSSSAAITATGSNSKITVSGGMVESTNNGGIAIYTTQTNTTVTVDGGTLEAKGSVISVESKSILVNGGTVSCIGSSSAIYASNTSAMVTVSGGTVKTVSYPAIRTFGAGTTVNVSGGIVNGGTSSAINSEGNVNISGTAEICSAGDSNTVYAAGNVSVTGGTITLTGSGGTSSAIMAAGDRSNVTVTDGTIESSRDYSIRTSGINSTITVSGGTVKATADDGAAIAASGANSIVTVSGGTVESTGTTGRAISANGTSPFVIISGGTVSAASSGEKAVSVVYGSVYYSGGILDDVGIITSTGTGYFIGDNAAKFDSRYFALNTNLYRLDSVTVTANGAAHNGSAATSYPVVATLSNKLTVTGITAANANGAANTTARTFTFSEAINRSDITLTVMGTISNTSIPVSFTTAAFGVNIADSPPTATNASANAAAPEVGTQLTGSYEYTTSAGTGAESGTSFKWYRSTANTWDGATSEAILSATAVNYTPTTNDVGKYLYFEVTPASATLTGTAAQSPASGVVCIPISAASVTVTAPVAGAVPQTTIANGTGYTGTISWNEAMTSGGKFAAGTTYTATITLTSATDYKFITSVPTGSITGTNGTVQSAVTAGSTSGNTLTVTVSYQTTAAKIVTVFAIKSQPAKLTYTAGETLDLTDLEVTITYNDGTSEDVGYTNFGTHSPVITMTYTGGSTAAHGNTMAVATHNGKAITLACSSKTANTNTLTVNIAPTIAVTISGLDSLKVGQAISGAKAIYTLSNGIYTNPINAADFTVSNLPGGLITGTATREGSTTVEIAITGTPTTYNASSVALTIAPSIPLGNVVGASSAVTVSGTVSASAVTMGDGAAVSGAPAEVSKTAASITVDAVTTSGTQIVEYAISATTTEPSSGWQNTLTFSDLTPNTAYYVFARSKANANYNAGTAQMSAAITTNKAVLGGTVTISGSAVFGQTLTAVTTGLSSTPSGALGVLTYQWSRNGGEISDANSTTYTLTVDDIGKIITVTVSAANCTGDETSAATAQVAKAPQAAPALAFIITDTFPKTVTITSIEGAQYQFNSGGYSEVNTYTSNGAEDVTLYVKLSETATHLESPASSVTVNTGNLSQPAPAAFIPIYNANGETNYTVTIPHTADTEYSFNGVNWSSANTTTGQPGDVITCYKRMEAKSGYNASSAVSASITLPLFKVQTPIASPNGGNFNTSQSVTFTCATVGASIYYTQNGSTPDSGSTPYIGAFTLTGTTTVKAVAIKSGMYDSEVMTVTFTKAAPATAYTVTFMNGSMVHAMKTVTMPSTTINALPADPTNSNYVFSGWYTGTNGSGTRFYAYTPVSSNITLYAYWTSRGGNGNSGSSDNDNSSSGRDTDSASTPDKTVNIYINGQTVKATLNADGSLTLTFTENDIKKRTDKSGEFEITISGQDSVILILPIPPLGGDNLTINTDFGTITIPNETLQAIKALYGDTLRLIVKKGSFKVALIDNNKKEVDYNDPAHPFIITYPCKIQSGQKQVAVVAVDNTGTILPFSVYSKGAVTFVAAATGTYDVKYNAKTFADVTEHWAADYIDFVAARGLFSGDNGKFIPQGSMTRAMFAQVLANLEGVDLSFYKTSRFGDVAVGQWYAAAVEWAAAKGIVSGYESRFDPNASVTREQMAVMLYNYMKYNGYVMPSGAASTFADENNISAWAYEAVKAIQKMGIVGGKPGNQYDPKATATRAEVATLITNFVRYVAGVTTATTKTIASNTMSANTILAMLPGKEDEFISVDENSGEKEA